eukprot:TRINITY_DN79936_c0_g1_i1.p1 TRINITY_DN79936_c0_g1~~TRINITY_DN79936_c0_g1_i1.p1  ORF type:complete len:153 (-),score=18.93 TRINITY_DN79936_c0_g1_i1:84-542(-)
MLSMRLIIVLNVIATCRCYLASWERGENSLTWSEAERWCQNRGLRMVSLDTISKAHEYLNILSRENRPYFWTGGFKIVASGTRSGEVVRWPSGASFPVHRGGFPWSNRGLHGPQPDGGDQELCIAALNIDFYPDGPHLHDIGCSHRKPVICE